MTTIAKADETHRVTPADQKDRPEGERISYELRTPTVYDRARLRSAVAELGEDLDLEVYYPEPAEIRRVLEEGIEAIYREAGEPGDVEHYLELVGRVYDWIEETGQAEAVEGVTIGEALAEYGELERTIRRAYPPYNRIHVDLANWRELVRIEAGRLLCVGAENLELELEAGKGARRSTWRTLDPTHVAEVGEIALGLFGPRGQEGNG